MGRWGKRDDMLVHETDPYNAEPPPGALADRVLTPLDSFYSRNHGPIPEIDEQQWRLAVNGLVERELTLSLADLQRGFPARTLVATLQCAGNRRAGLLSVRDIPGEAPWQSGATATAEWTGVALCDVLAAAGVRPAGRHVEFAAPDVSPVAEPAQQYGSSIGIDKAMAGEVLLAWQMNGRPLPIAHGAPLRVVVPGYIGARSVKWLERVTVRTEPSENYFQATAYRLLPADVDPSAAGPGQGVSLGSVALNSAVLRPTSGATLPAGPTEISGYAYAGDDRSVARVDVSPDGGTSWVQAELVEQPGPWAWCLWRTMLELAVGEVDLVVRAWDTTGAAQPESPAHLWNPKGYINNSWDRHRLNIR